MPSPEAQRLLTFFKSLLCLKRKSSGEILVQTKLSESSSVVTANPQKANLRDEKVLILEVVEL
jgi:hypothetical protein